MCNAKEYCYNFGACGVFSEVIKLISINKVV